MIGNEKEVLKRISPLDTVLVVDIPWPLEHDVNNSSPVQSNCFTSRWTSTNFMAALKTMEIWTPAMERTAYDLLILLR